MRKLVGVAPWHSATLMFATHNVRSFGENLRYQMYSMMNRVLSCSNELVSTIVRSDCFNVSLQRLTWCRYLYVNNDQSQLSYLL